MDHDEAFQSAVIEAPDDDMPRLIYADWLEERGDPRGEFIRIQCALAQLDEHDDRRWELEAREGQLLRRHGKHWARPIRHLVKRWHFRRGFVEGITIGTADFLTHARTLFRLAPIRYVRLLAVEDRLLWDLARCPELSYVEGIDLRHQDFEPERFAVLGRSPHLTRLSSLNLRGTRLCCGAGMKILAECPALERLTALDLSDHRPTIEHSRRRLLRRYRDIDHQQASYWQSPAFVETQQGWESRQSFTVDASAIQALSESPYLTHLTSLALAGYRDRFDESAIEALAASPILPRLTALDLRDTRIVGGVGAEADPLFQPPRLANLRELKLRLAPIYSEEHWRQILESPHMNQLTTLDMTRNVLGYRPSTRNHTPMEILAGSTSLANLMTLRLDACYINDQTLEILTASKHLPALRCLYLDENRFSASGLKALAASPLLGRLRKLSLQGEGQSPWPRDENSYIGEQGAIALAVSPHAARLAWLDLGHQRIGSAGAAALAASPHLGELRALHLWNNGIDDQAVARLIASEHLPRLVDLDLRSNPNSAKAKTALRRRFGYDVRYGSGPSVRNLAEQGERFEEPSEDE